MMNFILRKKNKKMKNLEEKLIIMKIQKIKKKKKIKMKLKKKKMKKEILIK